MAVKWSTLENSQKKNNFLKKIFHENGNIKTWDNILQYHKINKQLYLKWLQLIYAIPNLWKKEMVHDNENCKNLLFLNHHLIKTNEIHDAEKLNAKELYSFSIFFKNTKPTLLKHIQDYFSGVQLVWSNIYSLHQIVIDSKLRFTTMHCI